MAYGLRQSIRGLKKYGQDTDKYGPGNKPRDDRFIRNAAVLPELRLPCDTGDLAATQEDPGPQPGPLLIHGFTVAEYQQTYHSVMDPLLSGPCRRLRAYSLELGRRIKERLFNELAYPTLQISEQPDGKVEVTERFCVLRPTPFIEMDNHGETLKDNHLK